MPFSQELWGGGGPKVGSSSSLPGFMPSVMGVARRWVLSQDWGLQNGRQPQ